MQKPQICCTQTSGLWATEGGPRADCKPGSFLANSIQPCRILDAVKRQVGIRCGCVLDANWDASVLAPSQSIKRFDRSELNRLVSGVRVLHHDCRDGA